MILWLDTRMRFMRLRGRGEEQRALSHDGNTNYTITNFSDLHRFHRLSVRGEVKSDRRIDLRLVPAEVAWK